MNRVNEPIKQLFNMIHIGAVTNAVRLCQVKTYTTELADASLCMAVNEIHSFIMIVMTYLTSITVRR